MMWCLLQVPDREIEVRATQAKLLARNSRPAATRWRTCAKSWPINGMQLTQGNAALITANEKVQALESELAAANQKQADAKADRAEALRVAGKMWEDWRRLRQNLNAACGALASRQYQAGRDDLHQH